MSRKTESSMELLMCIGWALVIILLVLAALAFFGLLNPDRFLPDKADTGQAVKIIDYAVDENSITFVFENNMGDDLHNFEVNATVCNYGKGVQSSPVVIPAGKTAKVTINCRETGIVGAKFDSDLEVKYHTVKGGRENIQHHTTPGDMRITVAGGKSEVPYISEQIIQAEDDPLTFSGLGTEHVHDVFVDNDKNKYLAGTTSGNISFGNNVNLRCLSHTDFFIVKFNEKGIPLWVAQPQENMAIKSGMKDDYVLSIHVDDMQNVYGIGMTYSNISFGNGKNLINHGGSSDIYVIKYNSEGEAQLLIQAEEDIDSESAESLDYAYAITVDDQGYIYVGGYSYGNIRFDATHELINIKRLDFFIVKYDQNGNVVWLNTPQVNEAILSGLSDDYVFSIAVDNNYNVYVAGKTLGNIDFGNNIHLMNKGSDDFFVIKYNSDGEAVDLFGADEDAAISSGEKQDTAESVFVDDIGNVYLAGTTSGNLALGEFEVHNKGSTDFFLVKFSPSKDVVWIAQAEDDASMESAYKQEKPRSVFVDKDYNVYIAGSCNGNLNFGNDKKFYHRGLPNTFDFFVVKYNSTGQAKWIGQAENGNQILSAEYDDFADPLFVDDEGSVYIGGHSRSDLAFGNGQNLLGKGQYDFFLVKYVP